MCKNGTCPAQPLAVPITGYSDRLQGDTDGDLRTDYEEFKLKTDPRSKDTDGDGLTDHEEVKVFKLRDLTTPVMTDPTNADTDNDKRSDGEEAGRVGAIMVISIPGKAPYQVCSHPRNADADVDYLVDGDDQVFGTDPGIYNTDEDNQPDYSEVQGRRPFVPDFMVDLTFGAITVTKDRDDGDNPGEIAWSLGLLRPTDPDLWNLVQGYAQRKAGEQIPLEGTGTMTFSVGAVSTTDVLYEEFSVVGNIEEMDEDPATWKGDCIVNMPGSALPQGTARGRWPEAASSLASGAGPSTARPPAHLARSSRSR